MSQDNQPTLKERRIDGQTIYIVDGLFSVDLVRMLYESFRKLSFSLSEYDTEQTEDRLHLSHEFSRDSLTVLPHLRVWRDRIVAKTVEHFPGRDIRLARVHCNNQPYGDMQNAHRDIALGITTLYFANAIWQDDWQGELIFYDKDGEPHLAIAPKPGRLVLFPGDILHRGGVPSRVCHEPRLSVAFKFAAA